MSSQLLEDGAILSTENGELECVAVRYQETPEGVKHTFEYIFRDKVELEAERKAVADALLEAEENARQAAEAAEHDTAEPTPKTEEEQAQ